MGEETTAQEKRELTLGEIIDDAMTYLDFGPEVFALPGPDGFSCDMEPEEFELARASVAYMGYRLLLMYRMKRSSAYRSPGGGVAMSHYSYEILQEIADALGISGPSRSREDEVKRLYKVAGKAEDEDEEYRRKIGSIMEGLMEDYDLDPSSLGIVFI